MINNPQEVVELTYEMAEKKYKSSVIKLFVFGMLAGAYLSMGALLSTMSAGGTKGMGMENPIIPKLFAGATFPIGLILIILVGAELFTGNTSYLIPATIRGTIPRFYFLKNWVIVFLGNFVGAFLFDYLLVYQAGILSLDVYKEYIIHIAEYKVHLSWCEVFLRGVGANWMVCLAVWLGLSSKTMTGRMLGIWFPIMAFVAIGFEHSIANMFYIPTGMLYGADVSIYEFLFCNLIPATLGNIVGGSLLVGCIYGYYYRRYD